MTEKYGFRFVVFCFVLSLVLSVPVTAQGSSVTVRLEPNNTCGRIVYFSLRGFAANSLITNSSSSTEYECNGTLRPSGWTGWNIGSTDGNGNKEISVTHGAYGRYTYTFTDGAGNSASVTFEYGPNNQNQSPSVPTNPPSEPSNNQSQSNQRQGLDLNAFCVAHGFLGVERTRDDAYSWMCRDTNNQFHVINMGDVCRWQHGDAFPHVALGNISDSGSWSCNSQPQTTPANGYSTYFLDAPQPVLPVCPSGTGPGGIVAGNYDPTTLTQEQRNWLYQQFEGIYNEPAPVGYGGKDCRRVGGESSQPAPTNPSGGDGQQPPSTNPSRPSLDYGSTTPNWDRSARITASVGLNIRSGAGTNYAVIGRAVYNRYFELLEGPENGWYKIRFRDGEGWVSGNYIEVLTLISDTVQNQPPNSIDISRYDLYESPEIGSSAQLVENWCRAEYIGSYWGLQSPDDDALDFIVQYRTPPNRIPRAVGVVRPELRSIVKNVNYEDFLVVIGGSDLRNLGLGDVAAPLLRNLAWVEYSC